MLAGVNLIKEKQLTENGGIPPFLALCRSGVASGVGNR